jgi:hypothetical protein
MMKKKDITTIKRIVKRIQKKIIWQLPNECLRMNIDGLVRDISNDILKQEIDKLEKELGLTSEELK